MKCKKCAQQFNDSTIKPQLILPCRHLVCTNCLDNLEKCPECNQHIEEKTNAVVSLTPEIEQLKRTFQLNYDKKLDEKQAKFKQIEDQLLSDTNQQVDEILRAHNDKINRLKLEEQRFSTECSNILQSKQQLESKIGELQLNLTNNSDEELKQLNQLFEAKVKELENVQFKIETADLINIKRKSTETVIINYQPNSFNLTPVNQMPFVSNHHQKIHMINNNNGIPNLVPFIPIVPMSKSEYLRPPGEIQMNESKIIGTQNYRAIQPNSYNQNLIRVLPPLTAFPYQPFQHNQQNQR